MKIIDQGVINLSFIESFDSTYKRDSNEMDLKLNDDLENIVASKEHVEEKTVTTFKAVDGGLGWIVLIATIWSYGLALSQFQNYSLYYAFIIDFYNQTENNVIFAAWIGSSSFGLSCLLMSVSSILVDLFDPAMISFIGNVLSSLGLAGSALLFLRKDLMKLHFLSYSLLFGIGQSFVYSSAFAILPHYFDKKLGIVMGLLNSGSCVLIVVSSILAGYLITNYGLVLTFFVMAGLQLTACFSSLTFKTKIPRQNVKQNFKQRFKQSLGFEIFRKRKFLVWTFSTLFGTYGNMIPILTMAHYAVLNFKDFKPEILNVIYGISSGISSILFGSLMDRFKISIAYNYIFSYFFYGLGTITINYTTNLYVYCFLIIVFSVFDGLFLSSLVPMAIETAESNLYSTQALGYYHSIIVISIVSAPAVSGALFEAYLDYFAAYTISATFSFIGTFILLFYEDFILYKFFIYSKNILFKKDPGIIVYF